MSETSLYRSAAYLTSAAKLKQLPKDVGYEVAFIGRSNSGKSSAINTITGNKGLARTSQTPGRTQMINLFELDEKRRLVDLPGYGYAQVPRTIQSRWIENTNEYLRSRECLKGLVVLMDIRHPLKTSDQQLIDWAYDCELPIHLLLTKADKLKRGEQRKSLDAVQSALKHFDPEALTLQVFSSHDRTGLETFQAKLNAWFEVK